MAKPKGPSNPKTGNKLPVDSSLEITESTPIENAKEQWENYLDELEAKAKKSREAKKELILSNLYSKKPEDNPNYRLDTIIEKMAEEREEKKQNREKKVAAIKQKKPEKIEIINPSAKQLYSELQKGICTVYFIKKTTNTSRRMTCTLDESRFGGKYKNQSPETSRISGLVPIWDLDADNWRSFYVNRVTKLIRNDQTDTQ